MEKCAEINVFPDSTTIYMDFEKAAMNDIREVLGNAVTIQVFFYLTQSTYRNVQELKLVKRFKNNEKFNRFCEVIDALAFLPVQDVSEGMAYLDKIASSIIRPMLKYFEETYVNGTYRRVGKQGEGSCPKVRRMSPQFPPDTRFENLVTISNPTVWKLIQNMRLEGADDDTKLAQIHREFQKTSKKSSDVEKRQIKLFYLCAAYNDGIISMKDFLNGVSNTIRFRKL